MGHITQVYIIFRKKRRYDLHLQLIRQPPAAVSLTRSLLPIVPIKVSHNGVTVHCNTLLDSGSEVNVISAKCYQRLRLKGESICLNVVGVGGSVNHIRSKKVKVVIKEKADEEFEIECIVLSQACGSLLELDDAIIKTCGRKILEEKQLLNRSGNVDLIIGMCAPELHKQLSTEKLSNNLVIMETRFGNCLVGSIRSDTQRNYKPGNYHVKSISIAEDISEINNFRDHLQAEVAGIDRKFSPKTEEEEKFEEQLKFRKDANNRFCVDLPWKYDPRTFKNNREQAVQRDIKLMKQLKRDPKVFKLFMEQIREMLSMGVLRKVDEEVPKRYLPLLAIVDLDKDSTKVRICLDAKCKYKGHSFNDYLLKGRLEMTDVFQILVRFRCGKWAIQGDVKKMFWQIKLSERDECYHGVICNGETSLFTRVCFGEKPSPSIADNCMMKIAEWGRLKYPRGSDVLANKRYVDDLLEAESKFQMVKEKRNETTKLLGNFGFEVKNWNSNNSRIGTVNEDGKVLGMNWDAKKDSLSINMQERKMFQLTKRNVLSRIADIWDPLVF